VVSETVFLGLVTYRGTRFPDSAVTGGFLPRLAEALAADDRQVVLRVNADDAFDAGAGALDIDAVRASVAAELRTEAAWRRYLAPGRSQPLLPVEMTARRAYRLARYAPPWRRSGAPEDPGPRMLRRLVNIELSHLTLLREAVAAGADWVLIAEDDAQAEHPDRFATDLVAFLDAHAAGDQPGYVNVSRSFSAEELGTAAITTAVGPWGADGASVLSAERPVTNTVCAILYRGAFLRTLLDALEAIPMFPVLPIDWKLNRALMDLHTAGVIGPGTCWTVEPAPVIQRSMTEPTRGEAS
jgi:hypothetical protein